MGEGVAERAREMERGGFRSLYDFRGMFALRPSLTAVSVPRDIF